jgi:LytS/YehU family sensor histidine kinase
MQNEKRMASDYLNKFSRLIRMILESSQNELVPFTKDMEALQLYIELEQLRFSHKFDYHTHIADELINGNYKVPPLLIQPYVENAIIHGFAHSDKARHQLNVWADITDTHLHYIIEDDGVGRKKAAAYHTLNKPNHTSVGMQITEERIKLHNGETGNASIKITDLFNITNESTGTRVEVTIKIK